LVRPAGAGEIEDFEELDLEELLETNVYSAAKHEQEIEDSPSAVSVITREQIENTACTDLVCLLRLLPEVDVMRIAPFHISTGARAMTEFLGDKVLVLIDGREINDEVFGIVYWQALPVHLEDIERVEVIRGPGSALYGANAHSMVVSITTRDMRNETARVFLGSGEHERTSLHARVGSRAGDWKLQAAGGLDTADAWRIRDLREREASRVHLRVDHEPSGLTFDAGLALAEGKLQTFLAPAVIENGYQGHLMLGHAAERIKSKLSLYLIGADAVWDFPLYIGETKLGEAPDQMSVLTSTLDGEVQCNFQAYEGGFWIVGANYRWIAMLSEDNDPSTINQHRVGVFMHNEQRIFEDLVLTLGVRFDYNSITPFTISPRLAGVWRFSKHQSLRLAAGQAFRKPSLLNTSMHLVGFRGEPGFEGLEEFFRDAFGNEDLGNESITTIEAGYIGRFLDDRLIAEVDIFYNRYRDTIAIEQNMVYDEFGAPDLANSSMVAGNRGMEMDSLGGSVSATFRLGRRLKVNANYTFRHSWYVSTPFGRLTGLDVAKGDRVIGEPAHMFNLWFHYLPASGLRLGAALHGQSASAFVFPEQGGIFDDYVEMPCPASAFFSAFAAWRFYVGPGWLELGVRAYNLFHQGRRDMSAVYRPDGTEIGGELLGRRIFLFLRGAI
jgi:iron complex outermembrane receptor protein